MANVKLTIAGRAYDVHCADGEEGRLAHLAASVDSKAREIQGVTEVRQLLFTALMLADDLDSKVAGGDIQSQLDAARAAAALADDRLSEMQDQLQAALARTKAAEQRLESLDKAPPAAAPQESASPAHARALAQIADRIEALADRVDNNS